MSFPLGALARRVAAFALLWWIATEGRTDAWVAGAPVVAAAVAMSFKLRPAKPWRFRPLATARLLSYFLYQAMVGGIDVARRALHPRMPLAPAMVQYPVRLPRESARLLLANALSLLPGTLSAEIEERQLQLHVLDSSLPVERTMRELERRIAAMYGWSPETAVEEE